MNDTELKELTNEEVLQYIKDYLVNQKIKPKDISVDIDSDTLTFFYGGTEYLIFVEGYADIHYGVVSMDGVDLSSEFWSDKDEYGDYTYIDDYFYEVVIEQRFNYVKKTWKALEKLEENDDADDLRQIICMYFGLFE
jgi:hypothetical protein